MHVDFVQPDGTCDRVQVWTAGTSIMRIARENGVVGIIGECGGNLTCATCHAYIPPEWLQRLPQPGPLEQAMLNAAHEPRENSRLTCQIIMNETLDGIEVHLPASQY